MICHYCFFNNGFKFQDFVCNGCNHSTNLSNNISDIAIITVKNVDYYCIIYNISKSEANSLLKKFCSSKSWIYTKNIVLSFGLSKAVFLLSLFNIYKVVDSMDIYKSLNNNIGTVIKNPEMLEFFSDYTKTKIMYKHAVEKLPYLLKFVPDPYKT